MVSMQTQIDGKRKSATQKWSVGNEVRVGFLTLRVKGWDSDNGYWKLESLDKTKNYLFIPHQGLHRV